MTRRSLLSMLLFAAVLPAFAFAAGGWAITTVEHLPEYLVAGVPTEIAFTVRQHGATPAGGLAPVVEAKNGRTAIMAKAMPAERTGEYVAEVAVPRAGDWTITIMSGLSKQPLPFLPPAPLLSRSELLPIRAIAAGAPPPSPAAAPDRGRALFVAKGCVGCHVHAGVDRPSYKIGPELTRLTYPADHLASLLRNPPSPRPGSFVQMPNLGLQPEEISALVAFINGKPKSP